MAFGTLAHMIAPSTYLRLALDPVRLAILGRAALEPVDAVGLAAELRVEPRRVRKELGRLCEAGLLTDEFRLDRTMLRTIATSLAQAGVADPSLTEGPWTGEEVGVLSRFFSGSRLIQIPAQQWKRRLVLERLAQEFEPGLRYSEREVNLTLESFHPDYTALRRHMVDEEFLSRAEGVYWRTGGRS